ncbi:MAG: DUF1080 domain-containing protein [Phycisphaerales bacterium]|nr:MAG: DUF1080 domain-containing protein [Phycisphaerales bacterium]
MTQKAGSTSTENPLLTRICLVSALAAAIFVCSALAASNDRRRQRLIDNSKKAMAAADPFMGDWRGEWTTDGGADYGQLAAHVIALGKGQYRAVIQEQFDMPGPPIGVLEGALEGDSVRLAGPVEYMGARVGVYAKIAPDQFKGTFKGDDPDGREITGVIDFEKFFRASKTLGAKPPADAVVLFDGKNFDSWKYANKPDNVKVEWKLLRPGAMEVTRGKGSIITRQQFSDFKLHVEFRTPFKPDARGQGRGNSGVYMQGRYEVQILDSYGLEGRNNECGGIYGVAAPWVNMCAPPLAWQTYDITFRAPRFDAAGNRTQKALMTVVHNGVEIHENVPIPNPTAAAPDRNVTRPGGIYLQDHGNPVQYRNIWLVELPREDSQ